MRQKRGIGFRNSGGVKSKKTFALLNRVGGHYVKIGEKRNNMTSVCDRR